MKRAASLATRQSRSKRNSGVDEGQIVEALRLTPTERLEKAWRYSDFALDLHHGTEIRPRTEKSG